MNSNSKKRKKSPPSQRISKIQNIERSNETVKVPEKSTSKEKKVWTSAALSIQMKPSPEEIRYRKKKVESENSVEKYSRYFKCTKCQFSFKPLADYVEKVRVHSCLKVLFCKECLAFYEDGEFSVDSEGEEKYCRWCGEGGLIYSCSECVSGFCTTCIKKHFGVKYNGQVKRNNNWKCFLCFPKPLWFLRFICSLVEEATNQKTNISVSSDKPEILLDDEVVEDLIEKDCYSIQLSSDEISLRKVGDGEYGGGCSVTLSDAKESLSSEVVVLDTPLIKRGVKRKNIIYSSSDESDDVAGAQNVKKLKTHESLEGDSSKQSTSQNSVRPEALEKLEKILRLAEYQMGFGVSWSSKMLNKLYRPNSLTTSEELKNECQKIKWFFSILSTYLVESCSSVDSIEKSIDSTEPKIVNSPDKSHQGDYSTVVKFLDFVTNQVKVFLEKGIHLQDLLEGEIYYDNQVIGIKVKSNSSASTSGESQTVISKSKIKGNECEIIDNTISHCDKTSEDESLMMTLEPEAERDSSDTEIFIKKLNLSDPSTSHLEDAEDQKTKIQEILSILENA